MRLTPEQQTRLTLLCVISALACVIFAGVVGTSSLGQQGQVKDNTTKNDEQDTAVVTAKRKVDDTAKTANTANRRSIQNTRFLQGKTGRPGLRGGRGQRGARGLQGLEGLRGMKGDKGDKGDSAPPISDSQLYRVLAPVVSDACARGLCGRDGKDGTDGKDGKDGKDAPPVTDEQGFAWVAQFCAAHNGCMGPAGIPGPPGPVGPPGPIIPCPDLDPALRYACLP